jgi:hypothetical protein
MLRCYDCGQKTPDADLIRRDVLVGGRYVQIGGLRFGSPRRGYVRRVNLCRACAESRTGSHTSSSQKVSGFEMAWFALGCAGVFVAGALLFFCLVLGAIATGNMSGRTAPVATRPAD